MASDPSTIPAGICQCGCGQRTKLAPYTYPPKGWIKGEPYPYVRGHNWKRPRRPKPPELQRPRPVERPPGAMVFSVEDRGHATPCWVWLGSTDELGYGKVVLDGMKHRPHAFFYTWRHGPVPDGLELDHLCRVRCCCNPDHVEPVTHTENVRRAASTRLTIETAREIRRLHAAGVKGTALARRFRCSPQTVSYIVTGKQWKD